MGKRSSGNGIDPEGVGHPTVPHVVRLGFCVLCTVFLGYGLYGAAIGDLVLPPGKGRSGEPFAAMHLHGWAAVVALVALVCFCVAIRAAIVDEYVRFRAQSQHRRRSTLVWLMLSFVLLMTAMMLHIQA